MRISADEKFKVMERIVEVADRHISSVGLSGFNVRALCLEADVKMGTVYNHFKGGLDELILQVNSKTITMLDKDLAKAARKSEGEPVAVLFNNMAVAYLHFAIKHEKRFAALFEHQMANNAPIPEWHLQEHYNLFRHIEKPLAGLNTDLGEDERRTLARTIYSTVYGIVHLGRQGRLIALPVPVIEQQLAVITRVLAEGLFSLAGKHNA